MCSPITLKMLMINSFGPFYFYRPTPVIWGEVSKFQEPIYRLLSFRHYNQGGSDESVIELIAFL